MQRDDFLSDNIVHWFGQIYTCQSTFVNRSLSIEVCQMTFVNRDLSIDIFQSVFANLKCVISLSSAQILAVFWRNLKKKIFEKFPKIKKNLQKKKVLKISKIFQFYSIFAECFLKFFNALYKILKISEKLKKNWYVRPNAEFHFRPPPTRIQNWRV